MSAFCPHCQKSYVTPTNDGRCPHCWAMVDPEILRANAALKATVRKPQEPADAPNPFAGLYDSRGVAVPPLTAMREQAKIIHRLEHSNCYRCGNPWSPDKMEISAWCYTCNVGGPPWKSVLKARKEQEDARQTAQDCARPPISPPGDPQAILRPAPPHSDPGAFEAAQEYSKCVQEFRRLMAARDGTLFGAVQNYINLNIDKARMIERKRCARIANQFANPTGAGAFQIGALIADAIRRNP